MGYLSCRADSSAATCRSITAISPLPISRRARGPAASLPPAAAPVIERFAYDDLEAATSHFADAALLGRGSHGAVYKAVLPSGRAVAVKRPSPRRAEVDNEIRILSSVRGPRLVNLLGYSDPGPGPDPLRRPRLLVVEYMPNGTLYDLLHSNPRPPGWPRRVRLALQTARALRALHDAEPAVIHRDVKSANVLLDAHLDAHLGDFGLALRIPKTDGGAANAATPAPAGTLGYLDPAYVTPESLSTKTDVFSFGILLLEIMSGRKAIDVQYSPPSVIEWAVPLLRKGKVVALFDPRVAPPRDPVTRRDLASLALSCVRSCRERRPSMADIVDRLVVLSKAVSAKVWNGMAVVGNPCAIVDVQKTISKRAAASEKESTSALAFDDDEKEADATLEELVPLVGAKKPPRPLKNGKVFSEAGDGERRNLLELMARIDGVAGQRFGISRARTVRGTSDLMQKDAVLILRRNQTVRVVESEALGKIDRVSHLDASIKHKTVKEHEKAGKIQDKADEIQEKAEKIQDKSDGMQEKAEKVQENEGKIQEKLGETLDKAENIQEITVQILDKAEKIKEKTRQILDKAEKIQGTPEKVQENERKIQEHTEVVQHNAEKIQDKAEKIQCKLKES
ncbi:serine/threonine-protein kinase-like protein At3g51990 [Hordeum vulgare subsp. vulgare]|uniref:Protein kinase domain-containing protein n=1 Tax=Hordeum vulgare subsp. vulgare TaxID=112509 RepID=A0A8I7B146_HORVV|nr:serine/threonine-protein kinase-like protein At3g51990 [Hordeum vulgare subsp. vulgare]